MFDSRSISPLFGSINAIRLLDEETLSSGIQHLQIPKNAVRTLKSSEIYTIKDLTEINRNLDGNLHLNGKSICGQRWQQIEQMISLRLDQFASSIRNGKVEWTSFWNAINYEFSFLAARLDQIFQLDKDTNDLSVSTLNIGKAIFYIEGEGIHTVGDLVQRLSYGVPDHKGFGIKKKKLFANGLRDFIATINSEGTRSSLAAHIEPTLSIPKYRGELKYKAINRERMSETVKKLTLGQLHLHKEIGKLKKIGVENLEQLLGIFGKGLPEIPGVGKKARINLLKIAKCADSSISESGDMEWEKFAELAGLHVIPDTSVRLTTGGEFLASLEVVVQKLTTKCFDEVETATLVDRLIPLKINTVTLEKLGSRFGVSRERIRQKQKKVIERISAAVLDNYYEGLSFRFTQNFSQFWRTAGEYFQGNDSVSYNSFIDGLTKVWNVERQQVIPHLPLIYAILTSNSKMPPEFAVSGKLPPEIFNIQNDQDLAKPFTLLHPSKNLAKAIANADVNSIEQLLNALRADNSILRSRFIENLTLEILNPLSKSVTSQGVISWQDFYKIRGIQLVPESETDSPAYFVEHAIDAVSTFICRTEITKRSCEIFHLRTVPKAAERKTLNQAGDLLECKGPIIKFEESELLGRLHDAIFTEDYTASHARFQNSFIKQWKKIRKIYRQTSNPIRFAELLSIEWKLPVIEVSKIIPMVGCIIEGRPKGYTGKRFIAPSTFSKTGDASLEQVETPSVIRLRGFRCIH